MPLFLLVFLGTLYRLYKLYVGDKLVQDGGLGTIQLVQHELNYLV